MNPKSIAVIMVLSAAIVCWSTFSAFGGSHGGGGFSGGGGQSGASHGVSSGPMSSGGMHSYSSGARYYGGAIRSYNMRSYPNGARLYTNRSALSGMPGNYHPNYYTSRNFNGYRVYASHPVTRTAMRTGRYGTINYSNRTLKANSTGQTRTNGLAARNQLHNTASGRASVGLANNRNIGHQVGTNRPGNWARNNPRNHFDPQTQNRLHNGSGHSSSFSQAQHNHSQWCHNHHGHDWWHHHCDTIILVGLGWWGWWDGWWYPCWGYDPYYSDYPYDGPIYGYDGLPPDEAVADVQDELQTLGYYYGEINGVLNPTTRDALVRYQRDHGLPVTGTVDQETVGALGLS